MKTILALALWTIISITLYGQLPIDTIDREMITMSETTTKPYRIGSVYYERGSDQPFTGILYGRYDNGNLQTMQEFVDGIGNGSCINFDPEGRMTVKGTYIDNRVEGPVTEYYENAKVKSKGQYVHWKNPIGEWIYYDQNGNIASRVTYTR